MIARTLLDVSYFDQALAGFQRSKHIRKQRSEKLLHSTIRRVSESNPDDLRRRTLRLHESCEVRILGDNDDTSGTSFAKRGAIGRGAEPKLCEVPALAACRLGEP